MSLWKCYVCNKLQLIFCNDINFYQICLGDSGSNFNRTVLNESDGSGN